MYTVGGLFAGVGGIAGDVGSVAVVDLQCSLTKVLYFLRGGGVLPPRPHFCDMRGFVASRCHLCASGFVRRPSERVRS